MNRYIVYKDNGLFGLKNQSGEIIISPQYIEMYDFKCGLSMVRNSQYQYAYIDINNKQVVPFGKYFWLDSSFVCGFARVMSYDLFQDKEIWGIIDTLENTVVPIKYDKIWTLKEEFLFSVKAFIGEKEEHINLHNMQNLQILDGLKYIRVYSVEEFKQLTNCENLFVKKNPKDNQLFFTYGANIGKVALTCIPKDPVIAIVINSSGRIFPLLTEKINIGKTFIPLTKTIQRKQMSPKTSYSRTTFWDYEEEKMNDVDNWSDPYGDEQSYNDGWSKEDIESGLADAFEGYLDARWNKE